MSNSPHFAIVGSINMCGQKSKKLVSGSKTDTCLILELNIELLSFFQSVHDCHCITEDGLAADLFFLHQLIHVTLSFALFTLFRDDYLLTQCSLLLVGS